jgi:hypothetical protein
VETLSSWSSRQWAAAAFSALLVALAIGLPSDVIPNPVFGRPIEVTWWSYPVLVITAVLAGLLIGTYVRSADPVADEVDRSMRAGGAGGMLSFFAVGCPTCNKLVVVALGSSGALDWFAPAQPILAALSIVLLIWALRARLNSPTSCPIPA